jgi:hypothetical protein
MKFSILLTELLIEQVEIKELFGVSFDARVWNSVVKSQIRLGNTYIKNKQDPPIFVINGKEYPKEYKIFPIDILTIKINPDWDIGGHYDEQTNGYDNNRNYRVDFTFGTEANDGTINHELRHAYEDYMKISKGRPGAKESKEVTTVFGKEFEKFMTSAKNIKEYFGPFYILILGLYYTSKIERSGFAETIYDVPTIRLIDDIEWYVKYSNAERIRTKHKPEILLKKWNDLKENYKIPFLTKFKDYDSFISWACDEIQYKGRKTLKKLRTVKFHSQQSKKEGAK